MNINTLAEINPSKQIDVDEIIEAYSRQVGGVTPSYYIKERPDGPFLIIECAQPTDNHHRILNHVLSGLTSSNRFKERAIVQKRKEAPEKRLLLPETQLLVKEIAQNLTIDRHSFGEDFFTRYTASVSGFEQQIVAKANYVVYGRRGAGKSSLLAYAMHTAIKNTWGYSWVPMQPFANRSDKSVIPSVISAILYELKGIPGENPEIDNLIKKFDEISEGDDKQALSLSDKLIPRTRKLLGQISSASKPLTIFIDDIHVINEVIQPMVLGYIYKLTRANNIFLKISGINQLTKLWDSASNFGIHLPDDAQRLDLDHNLTMPDKSKTHIVSILNAHAKFCGLPNIGYLAGDDVLSRLILVSAGVPRDSLNLFKIAISKAIAKSQKLVSITSINAAASEMAEEKLKDVEIDNGSDFQEIKNILEEIKHFCIAKHRKNAFLVAISNSAPRFELIQKLGALRLVHILQEGITPQKAGQRYIALMLDYGFYVGIRAARSVDLIPSEPRALSAKELRSLPVFS